MEVDSTTDNVAQVDQRRAVTSLVCKRIDCGHGANRPGAVEVPAELLFLLRKPCVLADGDFYGAKLRSARLEDRGSR